MRESVYCAVCGKEIKHNVVEPLLWDVYAVVEYEGQAYYLCCPGCKRAFDENPTEYVVEQDSSDDPEA